jgi:hypothetical protein
MPSVKTLKQLNAASGLFFGAFLMMHLMCHYSLNLGYEAGQERLMTARKVYQHPIFESLLAVSLLVHFYTNVNLYMARTKINGAAKKEPDAKEPAGSLELQGHRVAGYMLSFLLLVHIFATRISPLVFLEHPSVYDYSFAALAIPTIPLKILNVYYTFLGCAGGWHFIYGTRAAIAILSGGSIVGKPFPIPLKVVALANHLLIIGAVFVLGKAATTLEMTTVHRSLFEKLGIY